MPLKLDLNEIREAKRLGERLGAILEGPDGLREATRAVRVLAEALEPALEGFEHQSIDIELDRLVALRNLSRNLDERAGEIRAGIVDALTVLIAYRKDLADARDVESPAGMEALRMMVELLRDLAGDLEVDLELSEAGDATGDALDAEGPVLGNRRTHIYHLPGGVAYGLVSPRNRVEFATPEAAEEAGFRRSLV